MMHSLINDDQNDLTDNIISRHFNQSLSSELFNFKPQLPPRNEPSTGGSLRRDCSSELNQKYQPNQHYNLNNRKYESSEVNYEMNEVNRNLQSDGLQNLNGESNRKHVTNQMHALDSSSQYQLDAKEVILNRNDKIRDLINDCELINNKNINNFVVTSNTESQNDDVNEPIKIVSSDRCHCKCHCTEHKKKNPFHQILKTSKLLNSKLSKIKLHSGHRSVDKKSDSTEDYNTFAPSLSNYSLSSSSSISSQTISVSSCSSLQGDTYNQFNYNMSNNSNNSTSHLTRPVRQPPLPPSAHKTSFNKPPAKLPAYTTDDLIHSEQTISSPGKLTKEYERVITKSFENLLGIKTDDNDEKSAEFERVESIYETIDSDYEDDYECLRKDDEEDLYQDIEFLDGEDEIYESLNLLNNNINEFTRANEAFYMNNQTDLDRKLIKQQKTLDKKRQLQADKLRKKFGLTGQEVPLISGNVKESVKANGLNLAANKDEIVLVLRIERNPPGLWLAKNERGKIGYIDSSLIDVDLELFKNLINQPDVLKC